MRARAIKGYDHYEKRVYVGTTQLRLWRRGEQEVLDCGEAFYIRRATSSKHPAYRIIVPRLGPNYVFTIEPPNFGEHPVMAESQPWED